MRTSAPPLSRTARLCPLFSSTSSLYIPELSAGGSGGPPEEEEEAPRTCWEKRMDRLQTQKLMSPPPQSQEVKRTFFFSKRLKRSSHFLACLRTHTTSSIGRSASFTVLTRAAHMKLQERSFLPFPLSLWQRYAAFFSILVHPVIFPASQLLQSCRKGFYTNGFISRHTGEKGRCFHTNSGTIAAAAAVTAQVPLLLRQLRCEKGDETEPQTERKHENLSIYDLLGKELKRRCISAEENQVTASVLSGRRCR